MHFFKKFSLRNLLDEYIEKENFLLKLYKVKKKKQFIFECCSLIISLQPLLSCKGMEPKTNELKKTDTSATYKSRHETLKLANIYLLLTDPPGVAREKKKCW